MKIFNKFILTCALTAVSITVSAQDDCKGTDANGEYVYPTVTQNIPAFPTAMGFGKYATGGRGGHVVHVTNLEDDATNPPVGSLRWAVKQYPGEPITVVFDVSGWIILKDKLQANHKGGMTIAGQTAPGEGITLYPRGLFMNWTDNIIVRNIRVRTGSHGWDGKLLDIENPDQALGTENTNNIIIDHCSFGWSGEEICTNSNSFFQTYQYCIFHEGLYDAGHKKGSRGYGVCWGGGASTFTNNLLAHFNSRSPRFAASVDYDYCTYYEFVNNIIYNWGRYNSIYGGDNKSTSRRYNSYLANIVNNYWKCGPATQKGVADNKLMLFTQGGGSNSSYFHIAGNILNRRNDITENNKLGVSTDSKGHLVDEILVPIKFYTSDWTFDINSYTILNTMKNAEEGYSETLNKAGCIVRDGIEQRIIEETKNGTATYGGSWNNGGTYGIIDDPMDAEMVKAEDGTYYCSTAKPSEKRPDNWDTDGDGMPDEWEKENGFDPNNATDGNFINSEGYTALEKYLCSLMGEEIKGEFNTTSVMRIEHAVDFNIDIEGDKMNISAEKKISDIHIFDATGCCRIHASVNSHNASLNINDLGKGIFIVWASNKEGYRNAKKITLK